MVMGDCHATVSVDCQSCGESEVATVYETVVNRRLQWVMVQDCPQGLTEAMGWDETPEPLRRAIIEQCGTWFLRVSDSDAGKRVAVMRILRDQGVSLTEIQGSLEALKGRGIAGTEVELKMLAGRLKDVGVTASVSRDG